MPTATKVVQEVIDDPRFLGSIFAEVGNQFRDADYEDVFRDFFEPLQEFHGELFAGEHSPSGANWPPLRQSTIDKKGHDTILIDTTALFRSLTSSGSSEAIREAAPRGMLFGTAVEYSIFHQDGTDRLPQREHVGLNDEKLQPIVDAVADHAVETLKLKV